MTTVSLPKTSLHAFSKISGLFIQRNTKVIHLYWNGDNHYDCVTSVKALLGCQFYCEYCDIGYTHRENHPCPDGCTACYSDIPCITEQKIKCVDCHRIFRSQSCFDNHKFIKPNQKKSFWSTCVQLLKMFKSYHW